MGATKKFVSTKESQVQGYNTQFRTISETINNGETQILGTSCLNEAVTNTDVVIITAGLARGANETRADLVSKNVPIACEIAKAIHVAV